MIVTLGLVVVMIELCAHVDGSVDLHNCTTVAPTCPRNRTAWIRRAIDFKCEDERTYICMLNENNTLVEACIINYLIKPSMSGCPVVALCSPNLGPILADNFSPCDHDEDGCPGEAHSGYYLNESYKHQRCFKQSEQNSLQTVKKGPVPKTNRHDSNNKDRSRPQTVFIIVGCVGVLILVGIICTLVGLYICHRKQKMCFRPSERISETEGSRLLDMDKSDKQKVDGKRHKIETKILIPQYPGNGSSPPIKNEVVSARRGNRHLPPIKTEDVSTGRNRTQARKSVSVMVDFYGDAPLTALNVPAEMVAYMESEGATRAIIRLEETMFYLLTDVPKALKVIGRLHFLACTFYFEFGKQDPIAMELKDKTEELGEDCERCFSDAENNTADIKQHVQRIRQEIEALARLTSNMVDGDLSHVRIYDSHCKSLQESVVKCKKLCTDNGSRFKNIISSRENTFDTLQKAEKKIAEKVKTLGEQSVERPKPSNVGREEKILGRMQSSFREGISLSVEVEKHWKQIAQFFEKFGRIIDIYLQKDVEHVQRPYNPTFGDNNEVDIEELRKEIEVTSPTIKDNADYAEMISELYVRVSQKMFDPCVRNLKKEIQSADYKTAEEVDENDRKFEESCDETIKEIVMFCRRLDNIKGQHKKRLQNDG